jgi:hypothetical protein
MICKACQAGGAWNKRHVEAYGAKPDSAYLKTAKYGHAGCDGHCDCQHVVGRTAKAEGQPK